MPKTSCGYEYERDHEHPLADKRGRVLTHRKVWFESTGMNPTGFVVHHKNGIKTDNRLENLELHSRSSHMKEHYDTNTSAFKARNGELKLVSISCSVCGSPITRAKWRQERNAENKNSKRHLPSCSRKCWAKIMHWYKTNAFPDQATRALKDA